MLPFNDLILQCTKNVDLKYYIEETCCLGFCDWTFIEKYLQVA